MRTFAIVCALLALALFIAGAIAVWDGEWRLVGHAKGDPLIERIEKGEDFRGDRYLDSLGNPTIGWGTKLPITKSEGRLLLTHRLDLATDCVARGWPAWKAASVIVRDVVREMAYVNGCRGALEFDETLAALAERDFKAAAAHLRADKWYEQAPHRVEAIIARLPK